MNKRSSYIIIIVSHRHPNNIIQNVIHTSMFKTNSIHSSKQHYTMKCNPYPCSKQTTSMHSSKQYTQKMNIPVLKTNHIHALIQTIYTENAYIHALNKPYPLIKRIFTETAYIPMHALNKPYGYGLYFLCILFR